MSTYGTSVYGVAAYGSAGLPSVTLTADPAPTGYTGILLSWSTPGGSWDRLRLVRNRFGFPTTADDGTVLVDAASGSASTSYTDTVGGPAFYYYRLFVRQPAGATDLWATAAETVGQAVGEHKYGNYLLTRLPTLFSTSRGAIEDQPNPGSAVAHFLNILGADANRMRDFIDHLNHVEDPDYVHGNLLQHLCQNWGYTYEPAIGMKQNRVLAKNAVYLRQTKGTSTGITSLASAVTGWGAKQLRLVNLMLDENDASFEQATGNWDVNVGQALLSQNTTVSFNDGNETSVGSLQVTCSSTGAVALSTSGDYGFGQGPFGSGPYSTYAPSLYAVPVRNNATYTLSAYFRSASTPVTPTISIVWIDKYGNQVGSTSSATGSSTTTTDWSCRATITAVAPGGAVWAQPTLTYASLTSGDVQYVDAVQFEESASASSYSPARQVRLQLIAPRVNEAVNAGFDVDIAQWTPTNATLTWDGTTTYNAGAGACKVVPSGAGLVSLQQTVTCDAGQPFTVAARLYALTTASKAEVSVSFSDSSGRPIGGGVSSLTTLPVNTWTQVSVVDVIVPTPSSLAAGVTTYGSGGYGSGVFSGSATTVSAVVKITINPLDAQSLYGGGTYGSGTYSGSQPATAPTVYVDDVQAEQIGSLLPYFDLHLNTGDLKWEGTIYNSRLHYYPNFGPRNTRLQDLVSQHIPLGASYSLLYAQPRGAL